jgi:hypothetical protein
MVFGAPGGNFDLASFSFQVPIFGLLAKPNAATKHRARVSRIGFAFISLRFEKQTFGLVEAERFYANQQVLSRVCFEGMLSNSP